MWPFGRSKKDLKILEQQAALQHIREITDSCAPGTKTDIIRFVSELALTEKYRDTSDYYHYVMFKGCKNDTGVK